jgi:biotin operon repressor
MDEPFTFTISRFGVSADTEMLMQHAELVRADGALILRVDGEADRTLRTTDVASAIAEESTLSEIRANQITRITAAGAALNLLPLTLCVPGDPDDFDETLWSKTLANEHTYQNWVVQPGRCRVAYVNDDRWCPWPTTDGPRMLPEDWPTVRLFSTWARLTFTETASMTSGLDEITLGLVTPGVVAACRDPDSGSLKVATWKRTGEPTDDAQIVVEWLLDWVPGFYTRSDGFKALMTQLYVEAELHGRSGDELSGGALAAGWKTGLGFGDTDTSEWTLELATPGNAGSIALDLIADMNERLSAIVTAARDPASPEGRARQAVLEQWHRNQADRAGDSDDEVDDDAYDEDEYEEDEYEEDGNDDEHLGEEYEHNVLCLLRDAEADGLTLDRTAESLSISRKAVAAASARLESRGLIVFTQASSIIWLPERRLSWLRSHAKLTPEVGSEIQQLSSLLEGQRAPADKHE